MSDYSKLDKETLSDFKEQEDTDGAALTGRSCILGLGLYRSDLKEFLSVGSSWSFLILVISYDDSANYFLCLKVGLFGLLASYFTLPGDCKIRSLFSDMSSPEPV